VVAGAFSLLILVHGVSGPLLGSPPLGGREAQVI
jgi:hypothetical protein